MELEPDFSGFCSLLNAHRVEFVVVGAYALAFHGAPRYTGDIDFLVRPTEENGKRLLDAISAFGFPPTPVTPQDIVIGRKVIQLGVPPVQIHVMSAIDGVTWDEVWQGRESGRLARRVSPIPTGSALPTHLRANRASVGKRMVPSRPAVPSRT